jgi:putative nucleotidyltransferase with HDIG domain
MPCWVCWWAKEDVSAVYRVRQFIRAAGAWVVPEQENHELAQRYLSPEALALFQAMPRYDQGHAISVASTLYAQGQRDPDLLVAALLHDIGKTVQALEPSSLHSVPRSVRLWHRVAVVLLRAFWPGLLATLAQDRPPSWRRPFYIQQNHALLGAELARQMGCTARTVSLIEHHELPSQRLDDPFLAALQAADNVN